MKVYWGSFGYARFTSRGHGSLHRTGGDVDVYAGGRKYEESSLVVGLGFRV